ncbi:MAG: FKBP-type peptidyl-prolyl cis-trans isomerase [Gemmatimonadaceae bacterium]
MSALSRMRSAGTFALAVTAAACTHHAPHAAPPPVRGDDHTLFALRAIDVEPGPATAALVESGKCLYVHYTGYLTDGTKFDSSRDTSANGKKKNPLGFQQGKRQVIAGWDLGFVGMRVGGKRRLIIPYELAYGEKGRPPVIPAKATLVFDVELMGVRDGPAVPAAAGTASGPQPAVPLRCPSW